jgi:hypothetical protein
VNQFDYKAPPKETKVNLPKIEEKIKASVPSQPQI